MCGRYVLYGPESKIIEGFTIFERSPFPNPFVPRYNIAPTSAVWVVVADAQNQRHLKSVRWGLIPSWAKDPSIGAKLNNARAETVAEKPSFRNAFKRSRCLIPANGFYEWQALEVAGKVRKQPHYIFPAQPAEAPAPGARSAGVDGLFALAGLTETWMGPDGPVQTCCVLTTSPNAVMTPIHDRMPVILGSDDFDAWLAPTNRDSAGLSQLLKPCPDAWLATRPVSSMVSNARNDRPELIAPLAPSIDG